MEERLLFFYFEHSVDFSVVVEVILGRRDVLRVRGLMFIFQRI